MSKPQWKRVEQGIYKTKNKDGNVRYQVRVAPETNSQKQIKRTCDSLAEAQRLVREAARIRRAGKNVRDAWDAEQGRDGKPRIRVPIEKFFEEYLADCDKRLGIGSKKSPSKGGSGTGLRPSTVNTYKFQCRTLARYLGGLSVGHLDDLTPAKFEEFRDAMVADGLSETTQIGLLSHLTVMIKKRKKKEFPPGFPDDHSQIKAVQPATPLTKPDDPDKWDGTEFEKFPALPLLDAFRLAEDLEAPRRLVIYLAALMGLRTGEIFGLQLGAISYKDSRVWLNMRHTRNGPNGLQEWVKTEDGNRKLPVPAVLQDALVGYCTEFHAWDPLSGLKPHEPDALLIVGPYGNPEGPLSCNRAIGKALERLNMTKEHLGGDVTLRHLRRTCLSYIQNGTELTSVMAQVVNPDEDGPDGLKDYGTTDFQFTRLGMRVSPKSASKWAGHREQGESSDREAAPVTLTHYNRRVLIGEPLSDVADWLSLIVKLEKRNELTAADGELDWSIPVAKKETLLTDGDEGWISYRRFADENGLEWGPIYSAVYGRTVWLQKALGGPVPSRKVLALDHQPGSGAPLRTAMKLEHLEMLRTYLATVGRAELCRRLGFSKDDVQRIGLVTNYMVEQGLVTPAEHPYSIRQSRFHREEVDRAYEALVVKPFLEQLRRGGAQPAATLGRELKDLPIFRTRCGDAERRPAQRKEQVERCLESLKADGLVRKLRNGSWELTPQDDTHLEGNSNE